MGFSSLESGFLREIKKHEGILKRAPRLAIACSGGLDSVVLAYLAAQKLKRWNPRQVLLHVDHAQREDSKEDANLVKTLAEALSTGFESITLTLPKGASEETLRDARTQALGQMAGADAVVLTAHHAQDQLETFLMRAMRGAHASTLEGIPAQIQKGDQLYLRPLLSFWKEELESYAKAKQLKWRDDSSNSDTRFTRNHLRSKLLPVLEEIRPKAQRKMLQFFETLKEARSPEFLALKTEIDKKLGRSSSSMTRAQWQSVERCFDRFKAGRLSVRKTFEFPGGHKLVFTKDALHFDDKVLD